MVLLAWDVAMARRVEFLVYVDAERVRRARF
jgi:hypothetical protein